MTSDNRQIFETQSRYVLLSSLAEDRRVIDLDGNSAAGLLLLSQAGPAELTAVMQNPDAAQRVLSEAQVEGVEVVAPGDLPLSFGDAAFDLVICHDFADHYAKDERWITELRRILAPDGFFALAIANPSGRFLGELCRERGSSALQYNDLIQKIADHFGYVTVMGQSPLVGSLFFNYGSDEDDPGMIFDRSLLPEEVEEPGWYILLAGPEQIQRDDLLIVQLPFPHVLEKIPESNAPTHSAEVQRTEDNSLLLKQVQELQEQLAGADVRIQEYVSLLESIKAKSLADNRDVEQLQHYREKISNLELQISQREVDLDEVRKSNQSLLAETQKRLDDLQEALNQAQGEMQSKETRNQELEQQSEELRRHAQEMEHQLEEARQRTQETGQQLEETRQRTQETERQFENSHQRIQELEQQSEESRRRNQELEQQSEESRRRNQELEQQSEESRRRISELANELDVSSQIKVQLEKQVEEFRSIGATESAAHEKALADLRDALTLAEENIRQHEKKYDDLEKALATSRETAQAMQQIQQGLRSHLEKTNAQNTTLHADYEHVRQELQEAYSETARLRQELTVLENEKSNLTNQKDELYSVSANAQEKIDAITHQLEEAQKLLKEREQQFDEHQADLQTLRDELAKLKEENNQLSQQKENQLAEQENGLREREQQLRNRQNELEIVRQDYASLEQKQQNLQQELETVSQQKAAEAKDLLESGEIINELRGQLDILNTMVADEKQRADMMMVELNTTQAQMRELEQQRDQALVELRRAQDAAVTPPISTIVATEPSVVVQSAPVTEAAVVRDDMNREVVPSLDDLEDLLANAVPPPNRRG